MFRKIATRVNIYLLKVNNRNTRKRCEICSKLTIKPPERRQWLHSGVFIVKFEHVSHLLLVNMWMFVTGKSEQVNVRWDVKSALSIKEDSVIGAKGFVRKRLPLELQKIWNFCINVLHKNSRYFVNLKGHTYLNKPAAKGCRFV